MVDRVTGAGHYEDHRDALQRMVSLEAAQAEVNARMSAQMKARMSPGQLVAISASLTVPQRFRLVEIAGTTTHGEVREAALRLLADDREGRLLQHVAATGLDYRGG